jgi:hypothetical protein
MNVISSVQQRVFPFDFYTYMRNKHPITFNEENEAYAFLDIHMFAKSCLTLCTCTTIALLETRLHYAIFYTLLVVLFIWPYLQNNSRQYII